MSYTEEANTLGIIFFITFVVLPVLLVGISVAYKVYEIREENKIRKQFNLPKGFKF